MPDCQYFVKRCSFDEHILPSFLADQIVLSGTSKDDFSALSGLNFYRPKISFSMWLHRRKVLLQAATWKKSFWTFCAPRINLSFFIRSFTFFTQVFAKRYIYICIRTSLPLAGWPSYHKGECFYNVYSCVLCHFMLVFHPSCGHKCTHSWCFQRFYYSSFLLPTSLWPGWVTYNQMDGCVFNCQKMCSRHSLSTPFILVTVLKC